MGPFERAYVENFGMKTRPKHESLVPSMSPPLCCPERSRGKQRRTHQAWVSEQNCPLELNQLDLLHCGPKLKPVGPKFSLIVTCYGTGCVFEVPRIRTAMRDICSKSG
jgi:hypothetical protein